MTGREFNWVKERAKCSLEAQFRTLAAIIDSDVKEANELGYRHTRFVCDGAAPGKILVHRIRKISAVEDVRTVLFELGDTVLTAKEKDASSELFRALPRLSQDGLCLWEIQGDLLEPWQVSRKALEDFFFSKE